MVTTKRISHEWRVNVADESPDELHVHGDADVDSASETGVDVHIELVEPSADDLRRLMGSLPAIGIDAMEAIELAKEYRAEEYAEEYGFDGCASS